MPGSLVWVALVVVGLRHGAAGVVGIRLPGLKFANQRVEAALRKELVYGEDDAERAQPLTVRELFANVQKNYFRLYFNYPTSTRALRLPAGRRASSRCIAMGASIVAGALTLGLFQQVQQRLRPGGGLVPVPRRALDHDHLR